ncbi:DUF3558 family protein [Gordonia sp. CPCC 206044]|uniref:DUF3558 family protein n=1 Tax=Gordonia sp. CPCC 206044 TaxID=3140793 RepID=UPI003AF3BF74
MVIVIVVVVAVMAGGGDDSSESPGAESSKSLVGPEGTITVPASENPLPPEQLWDPKELPDSALNQMQLERTGEICDLRQNVKSCQWLSPAWDSRGMYSGIAYSTTSSFDEVLRRPNFSNFEDIKVAGQRAVKYSVNGSSYSDRCDIAWGTRFGAIWVTIGRQGANNPIDPCEKALQWAEYVHEAAPK